MHGFLNTRKQKSLAQEVRQKSDILERRTTGTHHITCIKMLSCKTEHPMRFSMKKWEK